MADDIGGFEGKPDPGLYKRWLLLVVYQVTPGYTAVAVIGYAYSFN